MQWKHLQKDYKESQKSNNIHNLPENHDTTPDTGTEDWLKMLINELARISNDVSLTPIKILTGWGTQKIRSYGLQLKNKLREDSLEGI